MGYGLHFPRVIVSIIETHNLLSLTPTIFYYQTHDFLSKSSKDVPRLVDIIRAPPNLHLLDTYSISLRLRAKQVQPYRCEDLYRKAKAGIWP